MKLKLLAIVVLVVVLVHVVFFGCLFGCHGKSQEDGKQEITEKDLSTDTEQPVFKGDEPLQNLVAPGSQSLSPAAPTPSDFPAEVLTDNYYTTAIEELPAKLNAETAKCRQGICLDVTNRRILWEKKGREAGAIASMTKMMTVYLFMKDLKMAGSKYTLETVVPATPEACKIGGHQIFMDPKESFTLEELLKCVLIRSANDCAHLLGTFLANGDVAAFVERMNNEAKNLGMNNFTFHNAHGLHSFLADGRTRQENLGSPLELAHLAGMLMDIPEVTKWSSTKHDCIRENHPKFKRFDLDSTNKLLGNPSCPGVNGMKTGYTDGAGHCLTATCNREGRYIVVVIMGGTSSKDRDSLTRQLINWAYTK